MATSPRTVRDHVEYCLLRWHRNRGSPSPSALVHSAVSTTDAIFVLCMARIASGDEAMCRDAGLWTQVRLALSTVDVAHLRREADYTADQADYTALMYDARALVTACERVLCHTRSRSVATSIAWTMHWALTRFPTVCAQVRPEAWTDVALQMLGVEHAEDVATCLFAQGRDVAALVLCTRKLALHTEENDPDLRTLEAKSALVEKLRSADERTMGQWWKDCRSTVEEFVLCDHNAPFSHRLWGTQLLSVAVQALRDAAYGDMKAATSVNVAITIVEIVSSEDPMTFVEGDARVLSEVPSVAEALSSSYSFSMMLQCLPGTEASVALVCNVVRTVPEAMVLPDFWEFVQHRCRTQSCAMACMVVAATQTLRVVVSEARAYLVDMLCRSLHAFFAASEGAIVSSAQDAAYGETVTFVDETCAALLLACGAERLYHCVTAVYSSTQRVGPEVWDATSVGNLVFDMIASAESPMTAACAEYASQLATTYLSGGRRERCLQAMRTHTVVPSNALLDGMTCPITLTGFRFPVVMSDGHSYESDAAMRYERTNGTFGRTPSPMRCGNWNSSVPAVSAPKNVALTKCMRDAVQNHGAPTQSSPPSQLLRRRDAPVDQEGKDTHTCEHQVRSHHRTRRRIRQELPFAETTS
jgi:hypothetical protein